ncbi:MAG: hypothetical protein KJ667_04685 [Alphaproteobacteria bacterium]|nr:hypothetical protein [Alphaproteobacteria bacterium]
MKHIEVSKKIVLQKAASPDDVKRALVERLEKTIEIESLGEGLEKFRITGTTGSPASITRHARLDLDVDVRFEGNAARIIISGYSRPAKSLSYLYWAMFFAVLMVGLLPGSIETSADTSDSMDVLVLMIFGIFIVFDVNKKLVEPREFLVTALDSLDTTFG